MGLTNDNLLHKEDKMAGILENIGQPTGQTKGVSLDLGVLQLNITLTLSGVNSLADTLRQALEQSEEPLRENINKIVDAIRQLGPGELKKWAEQGGQEEKSAYDRLVSNLQQAAQRGEEEARNLLDTLGEKVSAAGQKMQGASEETRH